MIKAQFRLRSAVLPKTTEKRYAPLAGTSRKPENLELFAPVDVLCGSPVPSSDSNHTSVRPRSPAARNAKIRGTPRLLGSSSSSESVSNVSINAASELKLAARLWTTNWRKSSCRRNGRKASASRFLLSRGSKRRRQIVYRSRPPRESRSTALSADFRRCSLKNSFACFCTDSRRCLEHCRSTGKRSNELLPSSDRPRHREKRGVVPSDSSL